MLNEEIIDTMIRKALDSMNNSYTEHKGMAVGACVLCGDGTLYGGCSIDNASPSLYCEAEVLAIWKAVSEGKREFDAVAVVADTEQPFVPCGSSLQIMAEFGVYELVMANVNGDMETMRLTDFFPSGDRLLENHKFGIQDSEEPAVDENGEPIFD